MYVRKSPPAEFGIGGDGYSSALDGEVRSKVHSRGDKGSKPCHSGKGIDTTHPTVGGAIPGMGQSASTKLKSNQENWSANRSGKY